MSKSTDWAIREVEGQTGPPATARLAEAAGERVTRMQDDLPHPWQYLKAPHALVPIPGITYPLTLPDVGLVLTWLAKAGWSCFFKTVEHVPGVVAVVPNELGEEYLSRRADTLPAALHAAVEALYAEESPQ